MKATGPDTGEGFLNTPCNGSRDLLCPAFFQGEDGFEYCTVASNIYICTDRLEAYCEQSFPEPGAQNGTYVIQRRLKKLPPRPECRRIMIPGTERVPVCDSLFGDKYQPVQDGCLLLI